MYRSAGAPVQQTGFRWAYGIGLAAGIATLLITGFAVSQLDIGLEPRAAAGLTFEQGDCIDFVSDDHLELRSLACDQSHEGQVVAVVTHPAEGLDYPGAEITTPWFNQTCESATTDFLGAEILTTTLTAGIVLPDEDDWDGGVHHAVCYVTDDGTAGLTGSLAGRSDEFQRPETVTIDRLLPDDCFDPVPGDDALGLRSSDVVQLVDCNGMFHGLFFGRGRLAYRGDLAMPPDGEMTDASTSVCAAEFESFFNVESAVGYTFRFWRPSRSSWEQGDREVLCAVLSSKPIEGPFGPSDYPSLDMMGIGQCFNLLPGQTAASLSLDDHIRPIRCSEAHVGQMVGNGEFDSSQPFPGPLESQSMTERECRGRFEAFVGIEPSASAHGRFPYWFPDQEAWSDGDTRFACAILDEELLTGSLQGTGA